MFSIYAATLKLLFSYIWDELQMSVYLKFNIFQNGTTNIYDRSHFRPNFTTYKCMSMPPPHLKYNQNINVK